MKIIILGLAAFCVLSLTSMAQDVRRIKSAWKGTYLNMENGTLQSSPIKQEWSGARWEIIKVQEGQFKIKNVLKGTFLNIENGTLQCTAVKDGWLSARWAVKNVPGANSVRIYNIWKPTLFINIETGSPACSTIGEGWSSAKWNWEADIYRITQNWTISLNCFN
jgi:hypothetical protein